MTKNVTNVSEGVVDFLSPFTTERTQHPPRTRNSRQHADLSICLWVVDFGERPLIFHEVIVTDIRSADNPGGW